MAEREGERLAGEGGAGYTRGELMVAAAAREIADAEVVFVGMRLPLLAFVVAKQTHAPSAVGLFECGIVRDSPSAELLYTMGDPPNVLQASWCTRLVNVMGLLAQGGVDLGFLGGAEVDRFGNLNTSYVGPPDRPLVKLPGSGGAGDIASLSRRHVILMRHERRRFVPRVSYVTSPGHGEGGDWRRRVGLPGGGPAAVITTLGILRFQEGEMVLHSVHPGAGVEDVRRETGWELRLAGDLSVTPQPTAEELRVMRGYDPQGFWTGGD